MRERYILNCFLSIWRQNPEYQLTGGKDANLRKPSSVNLERIQNQIAENNNVSDRKLSKFHNKFAIVVNKFFNQRLEDIILQVTDAGYQVEVDFTIEEEANETNDQPILKTINGKSISVLLENSLSRKVYDSIMSRRSRRYGTHNFALVTQDNDEDSNDPEIQDQGLNDEDSNDPETQDQGPNDEDSNYPGIQDQGLNDEDSNDPETQDQGPNDEDSNYPGIQDQGPNDPEIQDQGPNDPEIQYQGPNDGDAGRTDYDVLPRTRPRIPPHLDALFKDLDI